jgi:hypothetical protein
MLGYGTRAVHGPSLKGRLTETPDTMQLAQSAEWPAAIAWQASLHFAVTSAPHPSTVHARSQAAGDAPGPFAPASVVVPGVAHNGLHVAWEVEPIAGAQLIGLVGGDRAITSE